MDKKVPEDPLDLTKKLLDQSIKIVARLTSRKICSCMKKCYSTFPRVQMSEALKFGYGAYYSCKNGWAHRILYPGAARSIYEILLDIGILITDNFCDT